MRATIKNYVEAAKRRREEEGEEGFSLIELIIVVVILGILVAIAIPIFANIQYQAQVNALKAAAADGATAAAAAIAQSSFTAGDAETAAASAGSDGIEVTLGTTEPTTIDGICATATNDDWTIDAADLPIESGPGC